MPTSTEAIAPLNVAGLLNSADRYIIPIYQRNYAWGPTEIEQLIQDVIDYASRYPDKDYYIGTLVVSEKADDLENYQTVDGQQRLTTLSILTAAIRHTYRELDINWPQQLNLHYASRKKSQLTMDAVFEGYFPLVSEKEDVYDVKIKAAYDICIKEVGDKTDEYDISVQEFIDYLFNRVVILRVRLPDGIDLNHYFEIMNSRGEQLEKHEILKARLMNLLDDPDAEVRNLAGQAFDLIWEACSNMESYVQFGFTARQRNLLFGEESWDSLTVTSFDEFCILLKPTVESKAKASISIDDILGERSDDTKEAVREDSLERFNSVINFPNFLLHVLLAQCGSDTIGLDDKRLIDTFNDVLENQKDKKRFVSDFIFNLLKCKFLFDKYVIKREFTGNTDRWSLKRLKRYKRDSGTGAGYVQTFGDEDGETDSDNRRVLTLLSMFHVSVPSMVYKHWLSAALTYLFNAIEVTAPDYISYLEHIAKSFTFDRFLAKAPKEYFEIIFKNQWPSTWHEQDVNWSKLRYDEKVNNFVFNYTDYLIWMRDRETDPKIGSFEFTFRTSVEHYYPQTPINKEIPTIVAEFLHSFGNLCLISHEKNSRLINFRPQAKKDYYPPNSIPDSLKQFLMMLAPKWETSQIRAHGEAMEELLKASMQSDYHPNHSDGIGAQWFRKNKIHHPVELLRALLGFGDFLKPAGGDKFDFFDFDYVRKHKVFLSFETFIIEHHPQSLSDIISYHLKNEELKADWRYLFIKNPEAISYCKNGFMNWYESSPHWRIELLSQQKRTKHATEELLMFLLGRYLNENSQARLISNNYCHELHIHFADGRYQLVRDGSAGDLYLKMWNKEGVMIICQLHPNAHGNSLAIKSLKEFGWELTEGTYGMGGKHQLVKLTGNASSDLVSVISGLKRLLKKGFAIDLK